MGTRSYNFYSRLIITAVLCMTLVGCGVTRNQSDAVGTFGKSANLLASGAKTAVYLVAVVKSFLARQRQFDQGHRVNGNMIGISILFPVTLFSFLAYLILRYPSSIAGDVNSLQTWTAASEVAFAGTVGLIIEDLFPNHKSESPTRNDSTSSLLTNDHDHAGT
jgi:hypothetical protein